jgi:hypothetical protein
MTPLIRTALAYQAAGVSVIPLRLDGSKAPALSTWQEFQKRIAEPVEVYDWFRVSGGAGIGLVAGVVSGGVEILDFDDGSLFEPWRLLVPETVEGLPVVKTPSGGWHVFYRCSEIGGNSKIAIDPSREKKTLIETRGQGGYVAAVGSAAGVHKQGAYVQHSGPELPTIPQITPGQRRELFAATRSFDKRSQAERQQLLRKYQPKPVQPSAGTHPVIAEFCNRHSWGDILQPAGWTSRDGITWTRPGKQFGTSAKLVHGSDGQELLTVFSGNAGPLSPNGSHRSWNKFEAWRLLVHQGDNSAAFRAAKQEAVA